MEFVGEKFYECFANVLGMLPHQVAASWVICYFADPHDETCNWISSRWKGRWKNFSQQFPPDIWTATLAASCSIGSYKWGGVKTITDNVRKYSPKWHFFMFSSKFLCYGQLWAISSKTLYSFRENLPSNYQDQKVHIRNIVNFATKSHICSIEVWRW